jgi:alkylation response protein AidB-like acyl-CoA dehydrogenase
LEKLDAERGGIDRLVSNRAVYLDARRRVDRQDLDLRREVMQLEQDYRVGRLLVLKSSLEPPYPGFGAVVKLFCSEFSQRVAEFAVHALGPEGLLDTRATRAFVYSTAYTVMGGASEVLRTVVADRILGLSTAK